MKTPDLPLVQPALKKAAAAPAPVNDKADAATRSQSTASGNASSSSPSREVTGTQQTGGARASGSSAPTFSVTVSRSTPSSDGNYEITVKAGRQSLTLSSAQSFPEGTELELTSTQQKPPQVQILSVRLPPVSGTSTSGTNIQTSIAEQLQSMAARLQQTAMTGVSTSSETTRPGQSYPVGTTSPLPAVVKALLTARASGQAMLTATGQPAASALPNAVSLSAGYTPNSMIAGNDKTPGSQYAAAVTNNQRPATTSTAITPDYPSLLRNVIADIKGSPLQSAPRQIVDNLPALLQLATPAGVKAAVAQSPLNYENQLLQSAAMAGKSNGPTTSPDMSSALLPRQGGETSMTGDRSVKSLFQSLWQRAGQSIAGNTDPVFSSRVSGTRSPSDNTQPPRLSLLDTIQILQQRAAGDTSKEHASDNLAALLAPLLATTPGSTSAGAVLPVDNLKGLLLFLLGRTQGNHHSGTGQTSPGATDGRTAPANTATMTNSNIDLLKPETFRLLQTALAQTENEQVRLIQTQDNSQFQIPLLWRQDDSVKQSLLCFNREEDTQDDTEKNRKRSRWQITLHFDLEQTGPLDVELDLCPPRLSATFWSEQQDTLADIQQTLQPLRERLTELGAEVSELRARHGRKPPGAQPVIRHSLVDIHT